ncbi:MAG: DHH family phosphoesterase, partial [Phycisphaerales bacterium]|nr:DHH family phosphoesterase [Phycisphaerales bacterium]
MSDWSTNTTLERIAVHLLGSRRIALLTHTRPDGDAVGSTIAVARALKHVGREAWPVYTGNWSPRFDPIVGHTPVVYEAPGCWEDSPLNDIGAVLVLDTGSWSQLTEAHEWLEPRHAQTALIDHHAHGDADVADLRVINTKAAAACEIVGQLCCLIVGVDSPTQLPADIAEPLYVGLATDTGWFRHSNVSPAAFRLAGDLLEAGVDHDRIFEMVEQNDRPARLALMQKALASL